jgi:hypothetical protein
VSLSRLAEYGFSTAILGVKKVPFRPHYQRLQSYFSILRARGHIFYDNPVDGAPFELLYLVEAKRFARN